MRIPLLPASPADIARQGGLTGGSQLPYSRRARFFGLPQGRNPKKNSVILFLIESPHVSQKPSRRRLWFRARLTPLGGRPRHSGGPRQAPRRQGQGARHLRRAAHVEGAKAQKSGTKALHLVLQFLADLVDYDEKSRHVVDLFVAPRYEKTTKRRAQIASSTSSSWSMRFMIGMRPFMRSPIYRICF